MEKHDMKNMGDSNAGINDLIIGVLIIVLSIPRGKIRNTYGGWNALIV